MQQMQNDNSFFYMLISLVLIIVSQALLAVAVSFYNHFSRELRYLNLEISRTQEREQRYWIKRKRKLWLSLIPFFKY